MSIMFVASDLVDLPASLSKLHGPIGLESVLQVNVIAYEHEILLLVTNFCHTIIRSTIIRLSKMWVSHLVNGNVIN